MSELKSYDDEYNNSPGFFWQNEPASFVRLFVENNLLSLDGKRVLDIGAGEGKNGVYLAKHGAIVDAVDISKRALERFTQLEEYEVYKSNINLINCDVLSFQATNTYDVVICYGLLHALSGKAEVIFVIEKLKKLVNPLGFMIVATFNNLLPPPIEQPYLDIDAFLEICELKSFFEDWGVVQFQENIITESHVTSKREHQHSISRIIAQNVRK